MRELYQPSNGTEGMLFIGHFCDGCEKDREFREDPESGQGCDILARSMAYKPGDDGYPQEWCYQDGQPTCTAFEPERTPEDDARGPKPTPRCSRTQDMF